MALLFILLVSGHSDHFWSMLDPELFMAVFWLCQAIPPTMPELRALRFLRVAHREVGRRLVATNDSLQATINSAYRVVRHMPDPRYYSMMQRHELHELQESLFIMAQDPLTGRPVASQPPGRVIAHLRQHLRDSQEEVARLRELLLERAGRTPTSSGIPAFALYPRGPV